MSLFFAPGNSLECNRKTLYHSPGPAEVVVVLVAQVVEDVAMTVTGAAGITHTNVIAFSVQVLRKRKRFHLQLLNKDLF